MKQQPMATPWENKQNCGMRHKVLKVGKTTNNITALSHSGLVIARSAEQS
jgi:hypothetical protein